MTELDFDELDKAVNSLMSDVEKTSDSSDSTPSKSSTVASPSPTPKPTVSTPSESGVVNKPTSSPLTTKRRGQFMDVIRPSSSASKPVNFGRHQGVTLAPVASAAPAEDMPTASADLSSVSPDTSAQSSPIAEEPKKDWPDPIDLATESKEPIEVATSELSAELTNTPLESPFLPDAKPEKRPLGGGQSEININETTVDDLENKESISSSETNPVATPTSTTPLPEELHTNLVAIEAESTSIAETTSTEPVVEIPAKAAEVATTPAAEVASVQTEKEVPAGGSIAQQYKEAPSSGDQTNGSIYDTANYHKAIEAHATGGKKSSALKWVMWMVLLLILGIGGGAAAFMLTR